MAKPGSEFFSYSQSFNPLCLYQNVQPLMTSQTVKSTIVIRQ